MHPAVADPVTATARRTNAATSSSLDLLLCLGIFLLSIVPRAAWIGYNDRDPQGLNDPALYMLFSDFIADGKGYIRPPADVPGAYTGPGDPNLRSAGHEIAYYPVGYPATVGGLKKARRHHVVGPQHLLDQDDERRLRRAHVGAACSCWRRGCSTDAWACAAGAAARAVSRARSIYTGTVLSRAAVHDVVDAGAAGACSGNRGPARACRGRSCSPQA